MKTKLSASDIEFIMDTILLDVSLGECIPEKELSVIHKKGVSYISHKGRGIIKKVHSEM